MFEKLRRAKSFIHRRKKDEERQYEDLDFSESAHLRRNIVINSDVLEKQKNLTKIKEDNLSGEGGKVKNYGRQISKSHEDLNNEVLEQLRRINFESRPQKESEKNFSKKPEQRKSIGAPFSFNRKHPAYPSERKIDQDCLRDNYSFGNSKTHEECRKSEDKTFNFDRKHFGYTSERQTVQTTGPNSFENRRSNDTTFNFDRKHPAYISERKGVRKIGQGFMEHMPRSGFPKVDEKNTNENVSRAESYNLDRKNSAYWSDRHIRGSKPVTSIANRDDFNTRPINDSSQTNSEKAQLGALSQNVDRTSPMYHQENAKHSEFMAKNQEHLANFDRTKPMYFSERNFLRQSKKRTFDRLKPNADRT